MINFKFNVDLRFDAAMLLQGMNDKSNAEVEFKDRDSVSQFSQLLILSGILS